MMSVRGAIMGLLTVTLLNQGMGMLEEPQGFLGEAVDEGVSISSGPGFETFFQDCILWDTISDHGRTDVRFEVFREVKNNDREVQGSISGVERFYE
jgi:hypothetical protein